MHLINGKLFYDLENHLDMESFDALNDKIAFTLAKNEKHFGPSGTSQDTLFDQSKTSVFLKRDQILKSMPLGTMSEKEALIYAKLTNAVTLGTHFVLRGNIGYPKTYALKHTTQFSKKFEFDDQFKFLFDWIDAQGCFSQYGRVIFWINEPRQVTTFHRDYPERTEARHRDPFIWLTGPTPKRLVLKDPVTEELHYSNTRACVFNTNNIHASEGHSLYTSWSLRIDGMFNKDWAQKVGIAEHFNLL